MQDIVQVAGAFVGMFLAVFEFIERHEVSFTAAATIVIAFFTLALAYSTNRLWRESVKASAIASTTEEFMRRSNLFFIIQRGYNYDFPRKPGEGNDWENQPN